MAESEVSSDADDSEPQPAPDASNSGGDSGADDATAEKPESTED